MIIAVKRLRKKMSPTRWANTVRTLGVAPSNSVPEATAVSQLFPEALLRLRCEAELAHRGDHPVNSFQRRQFCRFLLFCLKAGHHTGQRSPFRNRFSQ